MKYYAFDMPSSEGCFIMRGLELGVELVSDCVTASVCDICFHFDARQNSSNPGFLFFFFSFYKMLIIILAAVTSLAILRLVVIFLKADFLSLIHYLNLSKRLETL